MHAPGSARAAPSGRSTRSTARITRRIAALPPSRLDTAMKGLSTAANHSVLWFAVAARAGRCAAARPARPRRAACWPSPAGQRSWRTPCSSRCCRGGARPRPSCPPTRLASLQPADVVVVPVGARGLGRGVRHRGGRWRARGWGWRSPRSRRRWPTRGCTSGVHWASDVAAGAALGAGVALLTRRWWPVRRTDEARARPVDSVPALPDGEGLVMVVNQCSGDPDYDPVGDVAAGAAPRGGAHAPQPGRDLDDAAGRRARPTRRRGGHARSGVGRPAATARSAPAAAVAERHGLPLVVVPTGHAQPLRPRRRRLRPAGGRRRHPGRARPSPSTSGWWRSTRGTGADNPESDAGRRGVRVTFLNTASIGSYPDLVRLREQLAAPVGQVAGVRGGAGRRAAPGAAGAGASSTASGGRCGSCSSATAPTTRGAWSRRGGRRWTRACSTCAGCAPTCRFSRLRALLALLAGGAGAQPGVRAVRGPRAGRGAGRARDAGHRRRGRRAQRAATRSGSRPGGCRSTGATSGCGRGGRGRTSGEPGHGG